MKFVFGLDTNKILQVINLYVEEWVFNKLLMIILYYENKDIIGLL